MPLRNVHLRRSKGVACRPERKSSPLADTDDHQLFADPFSTADQSELAGLHCGDAPWSRAASEWIQGSEVCDSIEKNHTQVWIFRDKSGAVVGFGSLNETRWKKWPPPDGPRKRLLYIPQLGIDVQFHGKPEDPNWRFSNQIMEHLIYEARQLAKQIRDSKPASKHVELLFLHVHKENVAAQRVYQRFEFERVPGFEENDLYLMSHKLDLSDPE